MPSPLESIPEIANLSAGRGIVRIPCEQDVPFTPRVRALVDAAEFQRLAHITQLGLASRVYPGATHTRFEHALGVFHNALRYIGQLAHDARFVEAVDPHTAEVLMAAALLHDLGHWPFCHPIEDMGLRGLPPHEEFASEFLSSDGELADVLTTDWNVEPAEVLDVLVKRTDTRSLRLVRSILSGPIDIDKMDYLDRDSLHAGVPYGRNFDRNRLIQSLVVNARGDGLAISEKGRTAAELMVFARYVMFSEVYWHHAVRAATSMFARGFYELHERFDLRSFFRQSEAEMIERLRGAAAGTTASDLFEGVFGPRRCLFKRAAEYSVYQHPEKHGRLARQTYETLVEVGDALAARLNSQLAETVRPVDVLIDAPPPAREVEFKVDIYFPKEDVYRPLAEVSPVVESLARTQFDDYVKRVRIFVHPKLARPIAKLEQFEELLEEALEDSGVDE